MGVGAGELNTWLVEHCFPSQIGDNPLDCAACLDAEVEYAKRWCKCESGDFKCDINEDTVVDCQDLREFLQGLDHKCISRERIKALACCFLQHIQLDAEAGGCQTVFDGNPACPAIRECLKSLSDPFDANEFPQEVIFDPPLTQTERDALLTCYGCDCCATTGTHGAKYRDCDGDGIDCDRDGDHDIDCDDFMSFLMECESSCMPAEQDHLTDPQVIDLACFFIQSCEGTDACERAAMLVACLQRRLCRALTDDEMAQLQGCAGETCDLGGCCAQMSASSAWGGSSEATASYAACGGSIRCDQDCNSKIGCDDFEAFVAESQGRCNGDAAYGRQQVLLLACAFAQQCGSEEVCSCMVEKISAMLAAMAAKPLESEDFAHLSACMPCGEFCGDQGHGAQSGTGAADPCGGSESSPPMTEQGVALPGGSATSRATDAAVGIPGPDVTIERANSSDPNYQSSCAMGSGWSLSTDRHVSLDSGTSTLTLHLGAMKQVQVDVSSGAKITDSGSGLDFWRVPGPTTQIVHKSLRAYGGTTYAVWSLREPGGASTDFYRQPDVGETAAAAVPDPLEGMIAGVADVNAANTHAYEYGIYLGPSGTTAARLRRIVANPSGSGPAAARIDFAYRSATEGNMGKLKLVTVSRPDAQGNFVEVEKVEYHYYGDADLASVSTDCGTTGDLLLVVRLERVDALPGGGGAIWRDRVTHYRYHGNTSALSGVQGSAHQLKMTVLPEQMEFAAFSAATTSATAAAFARTLLALDDDDPAWSGGHSVAELASQVNAQYELTGAKRALQVWVQSGCGCGSGATHRNFNYTYVATASGRCTVSVDESPGPTASGFRRFWYETYDPAGGGGPQYLRSRATEELDGTHATTHRAWIEWFDYDSTSHMLLQERTPSTFPNGIGTTGSYDYQPGTSGSAPTYSSSATSGLSRRFAYVGSGDLYGYKRLATTEVGEGAAPSTWTLTQSFDYGDADGAGSVWDSTNSRGWLMSRARRYRASGGAGSSSDDIQETRYLYGFFASGGAEIAWARTDVEAELEAENGPGGWYSTHELYDAQGQNTWSVAADMAVTRRNFGSPSGQYAVSSGMPQQIERNADATGLPNPYYGLTTSGFGRHADGGSLVTSFRRDLLGRVIETVSPGGVSSYTQRYMFPYPSRPHINSYAEVTLPHQWAEGSNHATSGAASVSWRTASDRELGTSEYLVGNAAYEFGTGGSSSSTGWSSRVLRYALTAEAGRRMTSYLYNGLVDWQGFWAQLATTASPAPFGGSFASKFKYDGLGRLEAKASPNGTVTGYGYDILDRVVRESTDVLDAMGDWPASLTTTVEYGFDGGSASTPAIGNGNLTTHTALIASGLDRTTTYTYDFRDRRIRTQNPAAPHEFVVYDNLDRAVQRGVFSSVPTAIGTTLADRGLYTETAYSQRGLAYRERTATIPTSSSPLFLETNRWFDEAGRGVGIWAPTSPGVKTTYDGLGRVVAAYVGDRGGDAAPGASGNYASVFASHASVLTSDVVLEERRQAYDSATGLPTLSTLWRRAHNATATGAVSGYAGGDAAYAIPTYSAVFHDEGLRPIRQADYGTNHADDILRTGGSAPTLGAAPDWNSSGNQIVSETRYDPKGRVDSVTDPTGKVTKYVYDMADRRIAAIENWDHANPPALTWDGTTEFCWNVSGLDGALPDVNRTTTFVLNGVGATTRLSAYNFPAATSLVKQHTDYHFGVPKGAGAGDSALNSNDLLHYAVYPAISGLIPTQPYYAAYAYNLQGEETYMEEGQDIAPGGSSYSSKHSYARDAMGRLTADKATALGTGIDGTINALTYRFDGFGRLDLARSHSGYVNSGSEGTTMDAVAFFYDPRWQIYQVDQSPRGPLTYTGGTTPTGFTKSSFFTHETYAISGATRNYTRLTEIQYPDGSSEEVQYGASGTSPDFRISRATGIELDGSTIVAYNYVGLDTVVGVDYRVPAIMLDRYRSEAGSSTVGHYPGLDRFGRVHRQMWVDHTFALGSGGNPNKPPVVSTKYGYTKSSDRISAIDDRPGAGQPLSNDYEYDGLHRLVEARLGAASGGSVPIGAGSQRWREDDGTVTLDALGNWRQSWTELDASGTFDDATERDDRTHDPMNRIVGRALKGQGSGGGDLNLGDLAYDRASNLSLWKRQNGTGADTVTATHDAWNRLVEVKVGGAVRTMQSHNALHWRTWRLADVRGSTPGAAAAPDGALDQARLMYWGPDWRLLEERVDDGLSAPAWSGGTWDPDADPDRTEQYAWGPRYIDDIVLHRRDANMDGDYADPGAGDGTWFHLTDAQFSTAALVDGSGAVAERVSYSAYGIARHHWPGDVDGDGAVTASGGSSDSGIVSAIASATLADRTIGGSAYRAEADLDRDGVVNSADVAAVGSALAALPAGQLSSVDSGGGAPDSIVGWDGYLYSPECALYEVRFRVYEPLLGRWIERDPAGYVRTASLYAYVSGSPITKIDPQGLQEGADVRERIRLRTQERLRQLAGQPSPKPCCTIADELTLQLHGDWTWAQSPIARLDLHGKTVWDVAASLKEQMSFANWCCIRHLYIDAHNFGPGKVSFGSDDSNEWRSGEVGSGYFQFSVPEGQAPSGMTAERLRAIAAIREILGSVCSNGTITFVQCWSGGGGAGIQLAYEIAREAGRGISVRMFTGKCKFRWGSPVSVEPGEGEITVRYLRPLAQTK